MAQRAIPAVFMRGGTSRAIFFHLGDLPEAAPPKACEAWNSIFLSALGSPDRYGRQLNGLGGGASSLSKIAVIGRSTRSDADVDYTFAQVAITEPVVGYKGNCGNISSAVGPFAVDEGLVDARGDQATVRIHNTNTGKIIVASFAVRDGRAVVDGDYEIPGVSGTGAPIRLAFLDPGGSTTGRLLPSGEPRDVLDVASIGQLEVSMIDAANPTVFIDAASLGLKGSEQPDELAHLERIAVFEQIRVAAAVRMGLAVNAEEARSSMKSLPLVSIVSPPGGLAKPAAMDVQTRMVSSGQVHRSTPLTGAMCLAVAAQVPGSIVHAVAAERPRLDEIRIGHPAGIMSVSTRVASNAGEIVVQDVVVTRTARRLMEGRVFTHL